MAQADVLTLVDDISLAQANSTETTVMYDEIIRELGFMEVLTGTETIAIQKNVSTYETSPLTIRAMEFATSKGFLTRTNDIGIGSVYNASWKNLKGNPIAVSMDDENANNFTLVPVPLNDDTLTIIRTETRDDVPTWLELPIAFEILSREFMRESDHQDIEFSGLCKQVADLLFSLVGVNKNAST